MLLVVVAFFTPLIARGYVKVRKLRNTGPPIRLSLWHRCISVLLAYIMLIGPFGFEQLAHGDTQYDLISTLDWANGNRTVEYTYDANGSCIEKETKVTTTQALVETVTYEYNLQNRLWRVTTDDTGATDAVVEYTYNDAGIKVKAYSYDTPDGGETKQNEATKIFLIDSHNHTGYAQVLEEWSPSGSHPDVTYTIGDDVVTQYDSTNGARHLLYDGHGSTRQLVDNDEDVKDAFSYDGYGVMLGANPANAATSLLYTGEMYDSSASMYYLRARWYDAATGRFNRIDPFAGNTQDPQSLHKYLYCHANPPNNIDPSGQLIGYIILGVIIAICLYLSISHTLEERRIAKGLVGLAALDFTEDELLNLIQGFQEGTTNLAGNPSTDTPAAWDYIIPDTIPPRTARNEAEWQQACEAVGAITLGTNVQGVVAGNLSPGQVRIVRYFESSEWYGKNNVLSLQTKPGDPMFPQLRGSAEIIAMTLRINECINYAEYKGFSHARISEFKGWTPPRPPYEPYALMYPQLFRED